MLEHQLQIDGMDSLLLRYREPQVQSPSRNDDGATRPMPTRPSLQTLGIHRVEPEETSPRADSDLSELDWSWGFTEPVLSVLSEDHGLLMGSTLADARVALKQASLTDDVLRATDYNVELQLPTVSWALRVRRHSFLRVFGDEVILRSTTESHRPTEAQKILTHPDAAERYLYAWATPDERAFSQWIALDLGRLRRVWADPDRRELLTAHEVNLRGSNRGLALPISSLIVSKVVMRAMLARPSFANLSEAEGFLVGCRALDDHSPAERRAVATFLLRNALNTRYYIGPDPL